MKLSTGLTLGAFAISASYVAFREPECGEDVRIKPVHVPPHGMGEWGFRRGERVSEEDYQCAADWQHYKRDCKPVRDETSARVAKILVSDCESAGQYSTSKFGPDFYNLSSVQDTKGDCNPVISEMEERLRSIKTNCEN